LMLAFFLLLAQRALFAGLLGALPRRRARVHLAAALREARDGVANFFATMALINLGLGVATALVLAAIGLPRVLAWGGVIFLLLFIPYLGPLAIALLLAAAGAGRDGMAALLAPAAFLLLHGIEAHFISPLVMGRRLRVGRPALLVAVIAGAWAAGVAGGVLAVPVLIALRAGLRRAPGFGLANVLLAGEPASAPSLVESSRAGLAADPGTAADAGAAGPRVRGMPVLVEKESPTPCASPSSPKPTPPKSTASR
jgi:predicted PurR-regulated permease PerM